MKNPLQKFFLILLLNTLLGLLLFQILQRWKTERADLEQDWLTMQRDRRDLLNTTCLQQTSSVSKWQLQHNVASQLFVDETHKFIYCEVPKVGCSNWKKILVLLTLNITGDPADVNHETVHTTHFLKRLSSYSPEQQAQLLSTYTKVMFTRHPLERLVSAYRDKLLHSEPYYGGVVANEIKVFVKRKNFTEKVTFQEFVSYVVTRNLKNIDIHWKPMFLLCDPCNIQYDILGKFETLVQDSDHVLRRIGAPETFYYPDVKTHASEKRTNKDITQNYLRQLTFDQMQMALKLYQTDFSMFNYSFTL